jgi:hypothetical protein
MRQSPMISLHSLPPLDLTRKGTDVAAESHQAGSTWRWEGPTKWGAPRPLESTRRIQAVVTKVIHSVYTMCSTLLPSRARSSYIPNTV